MVSIDSIKCTGCGNCVDVCPQQAITIDNIDNDVAVVNQRLCTECGTCVAICPASAIREVTPIYAKLQKGGDSMPYGYGRGFGFRGASRPWPYVGRGRGGLPRCWHPGFRGAIPYPVPAPYWSVPAHEEELGFLKDQADIMKRQLEDIKAQIKELEAKAG